MTAEEILADVWRQRAEALIYNFRPRLRIWLSHEDARTLMMSHLCLQESLPWKLFGEEVVIDGDFVPVVEVVDPFKETQAAFAEMTRAIQQTSNAFVIFGQKLSILGRIADA